MKRTCSGMSEKFPRGKYPSRTCPDCHGTRKKVTHIPDGWCAPTFAREEVCNNYDYHKKRIES